MDEEIKKDDHNNEEDITETKEQNNSTITVVDHVDPSIKEEVAPISSHRKIDSSDLNNSVSHKAGRVLVKVFKRIIRRIAIMLVGIVQYAKDVFNFYAKNDFTVTMMYEYPMKWHFGYLLINSLWIAVIPLVMVWRIVLSHHTFFSGMKLYPAMFKLAGILFICSLLAVYVLAMVYKIIERLANHHNINYFNIVKALNLKGITLNPYIIIFILLYFIGYNNIYVLLVASVILLDGCIISYIMLAKLLKRYRLIKDDQLRFIVPLTFFYSLVYVLIFGIIYFTNSHLINAVMNMLF